MDKLLIMRNPYWLYNIFICFILCSNCFYIDAQESEKFAFDSGYLDEEYTKNYKVYPNIKQAIESNEDVYAVRVSAASKYLAEIKNLKKIKFLYLDETFTANSYYLAKEGIETFFKLFGQLPELEYICIYDSKLLQYMNHLTYLKGIKIKKFDWNIFQTYIKNYENLEILIIEDATITKLPSAIGRLKSLKQLEINATNIAVLPDFILLQNLVVLKLMIGKITDLPETFKLLQNLKYLKITGLTYFKKFPTEICNLTNLEELYLEVRNGRPLPQDIGNLTKLIKLYLYDCQKISSFPETIGNLKKIEEIYLSDAMASIDISAFNKIDHPFILLVNRCDYVKMAKNLTDINNLKAIVIPSSTYPSIIKKMEKYLNAEKIIKKDY
jgi:Leucine-rich repeat (LRR) protein